MLLFGGAANLKSSSKDWQATWIDKSNGASDWAYARIDSLNAYTAAAAASRSLRHILHFKAGSPDFVVVYDDAASSSGKSKSFNLHYDEGCTTYSYAVPNVTCRASSSSLLSSIVYPSGSALATTQSTSKYGKRLAVCASADGTTCDATNTAADFLVVHQLSSDPNAAQLAVSGVATIDAGFRGVEIGGPNPAVAVFPKVGATHDASSFATSHRGTAQYLVAGLEAGSYDVSRAGSGVFVNDQAVGADGTLYFTSVSGAFTVTRKGTSR